MSVFERKSRVKKMLKIIFLLFGLHAYFLRTPWGSHERLLKIRVELSLTF